jgi:hypothetical protein
MFAYRSLVIARQLEELRAASADRRLAKRAIEEASPKRSRWSWLTRLDERPFEMPSLTNYPYPVH